MNLRVWNFYGERVTQTLYATVSSWLLDYLIGNPDYVMENLIQKVGPALAIMCDVIQEKVLAKTETVQALLHFSGYNSCNQ